MSTEANRRFIAQPPVLFSGGEGFDEAIPGTIPLKAKSNVILLPLAHFYVMCFALPFWALKWR